MPIRPTVSAIEASIMPPIKSFLESRSAELARKSESTPEEGTDMLAEAIALGIAKALSDPSLAAAFAVIIDTNAAVVTPVGTLANNLLKASASAPVAPNPNLSRPY